MSGKHFLITGTFDPFTKGHLDIAVRASRLADKVTIVVLNNAAKSSVFSMEERVNLALRATSHYDNINAIGYSGLIADCYRELGADAVVRGIRDGVDLSYETPMTEINRSLFEDYETIYLPCRPELAHIRSSVVRELASYGADYSAMVPESIFDEIDAKLSAERGCTEEQ